MQLLYKLILRRPFFKGQDRLFNYLFTHRKFDHQSVIVRPLEGNFKIKCDPATWIGAKIIYTGNYEPALKKVFRSVIKKGDRVLDVGANIGFHTLYFAELVGEDGKVTAFEPVPNNFAALNANLKLNNFQNIETKNIALSNKQEKLHIAADENSQNPGAYNLFDLSGDIVIDCFLGDNIIGNDKVDVIKIDVEGYESFVIDGLLQTIKKNRPTIIFEFDKFYHQKTGRPNDYIFSILQELNYRFMHVYKDGPKPIAHFNNLQSGNILAIPNA